MLRKIIKINQELCNGCGACAAACHEGAIEMIDGKATLTREDYCDGLGDCLPTCPANAISFEMREAPAYDEAAVKRAQALKAQKAAAANAPVVASQLINFPIQIKLAPVNASYFNDADLLIAADCTAYSYGNFHNDFMRGRITLIGCSKLDAVDYAEKLGEIITNNNIKSITVARMEVPCCGGMEYAVERALEASGKSIPCKVVIITPEGEIV